MVVNDLASLSQMLSTSKLGTVSLPAAPGPFLQMPRCGEQPLMQYLCRLWLEAGFTDSEWEKALQMFDTELAEQRRQQQKESGGGSEGHEGRWSLETFSMWLMRRGRRLRECAQWFKAFDFDQDDWIGVADFLLGLAAAGSSRPPASVCGLLTSLGLFRLLDFDKVSSLNASGLETLLKDMQITLSGGETPMSQLAEQATDFSKFRASLMPRIGNNHNFRLQVFGGD